MTVVLDKDVLLSESGIWQRQCDFYKRSGVAAWYNQVPFYATSNAFIARAYADMIFGFMRDWHNKNGSKRFRILELGAGCGQFSYLCLQELNKKNNIDISWQYIMSDFDESLLKFWRNHKAFKSFVDDETVLFVKDKIGDDKGVLNQYIQESDAPIIVIANYLFDSLPVDIYKIANEEIFPVNVTLTTEEDNLDDHQNVKDFENVTLTCLPQPKEESTDPILNQYKFELLDSYILYPTTSLALLHELVKQTEHGVFLLASDKAYVDIEELDYLNAPELTGHNGCFSMMVNFDAISRFAKLHDGNSLLPSTRAGIKTAAFSLGFDFRNLDTSANTLARNIEQFAPTDYLNFYRNMQRSLESFNLEDALSFLALSNWDATVFQRLYDRIFEQLDGADMLSINCLLEHLPVIAEHYYWLEQGQDTLFQIAIIYHTLKHYDAALVYYEKSLDYFEGIFGLYFNMGVCHYHLDQTSEARGYFEKAIKLDPDDTKTKEWLDRLSVL
jgi:hypothetical protein